MREVLSLVAYAKHRGVSHPAVVKAIDVGRLTSKSCTLVGKRWKIDVELADAEWNANTDQSQQREQPVGEEKIEQIEMFQTVQPPAADKAPKDVQSGITLLKARAKREDFQAKIAEAEWRKLTGEWVDAEDVRAAWFRVGRAVRDAVLGVCGTMAPKLVGMRNIRDAELALRDALEEALGALAGEAPSDD